MPVFTYELMVSEDGSGTLEEHEFVQILADEAVKNTLTSSSDAHDRVVSQARLF